MRVTETDELRGGLRELGVQYQACGDSFTMWKHDGKTATYAEYPEGGKLKAFVTPAQAIAATLGSDNSDTVKHLMKLQGGHYSWPMLYEAVTGDPFDYDCPPSKSEEVFIEKLISIVGGRKVVDE